MTPPLMTRRLMLGESLEIEEVYRFLYKLAKVDIAVLIRGETGTGKELAAQELHRLSLRGKAPFVAVNVAAIPENLLEAELFGYRKGAFTGALQDHIGLIERSDCGVLFLDEIGEMPLHLQAKLLRVLQEKQVTRVGEARPRQVDFRLVSATHVNLPEAVAAGDFRQDLYYRIAGAVLNLPPLRERGGDVVSLANFIQRRFCDRNSIPMRELSETAIHSLQSHAWHGNVRELENVMERAAVFAGHTHIHSEDLNIGSMETEVAGAQDVDNLEEAKAAWMRAHILKVLKKNAGHKGLTAQALGVGRRTLFRYMEALGIA